MSWREAAACRGADPSLFFPERGDDSRTAKQVCVGCPVRAECRAEGFHEKHGIWGGLSERQRRQARRGESVEIRMGRPPRAQHGQRAMYVAGCRCEPCVEANRAYARQAKQRSKSRESA